LDKTSNGIDIVLPKTDRIAELTAVSGKIRTKIKTTFAKITIESLLAKEVDGNKSYSCIKLLEVTVPIKNKKFQTPVSIKELLTGEEILIITITIDNIEVQKILF
jgi:hypothetical protein